MRSRIEFHEFLQGLFPFYNLYFQPPETIKMKYPAIVYDISRINLDHADNLKYRMCREYSVTLITKDSDTPDFETLLEQQYVSFDRHFVADNMHHYVYTIFY